MEFNWKLDLNKHRDILIIMNKKEVFMCLDETDIGPIFSTFDKAKDYLTENGMNEKLNNHDFVHGYYPVIIKIEIDDERVLMDHRWHR